MVKGTGWKLETGNSCLFYSSYLIPLSILRATDNTELIKDTETLLDKPFLNAGMQ